MKDVETKGLKEDLSKRDNEIIKLKQIIKDLKTPLRTVKGKLVSEVRRKSKPRKIIKITSSVQTEANQKPSPAENPLTTENKSLRAQTAHLTELLTDKETAITNFEKLKGELIAEITTMKRDIKS